MSEEIKEKAWKIIAWYESGDEVSISSRTDWNKVSYYIKQLETENKAVKEKLKAIIILDSDYKSGKYYAQDAMAALGKELEQ